MSPLSVIKSFFDRQRDHFQVFNSSELHFWKEHNARKILEQELSVIVSVWWFLHPVKESQAYLTWVVISSLAKKNGGPFLWLRGRWCLGGVFCSLEFRDFDSLSIAVYFPVPCLLAWHKSILPLNVPFLITSCSFCALLDLHSMFTRNKQKESLT